MATCSWGLSLYPFYYVFQLLDLIGWYGERNLNKDRAEEQKERDLHRDYCGEEAFFKGRRGLRTTFHCTPTLH